jgi:hypothetical protein
MDGKLLDKKSFPKLIASYERLHGAEAAEEILNLAVLINLLRGENSLGRQNLQRIGISHPIPLKSRRLFTVKHREHHAARTQQIRKLSDHQLG